MGDDEVLVEATTDARGNFQVVSPRTVDAGVLRVVVRGFATLAAQGARPDGGTIDNRATRFPADKSLQRLKRLPESRTMEE